MELTTVLVSAYGGNQIIADVLVYDQANSVLQLGWKCVLVYGGCVAARGAKRGAGYGATVTPWLPCSDHLRCTVARTAYGMCN